MVRVLEHDHPGALADFLLRHGSGPLPADTASTAIPAYVNHGRWVVNCPFCPSAQQASENDPRFFCVDCKNAGAGGKWLPVAWPKNRKALEELLMARPEVTTRNWNAHETEKDLARENAQRGL